MDEKKYNIDLYETTKLGRVLRVSLGIISLAATGWFIYNVSGTQATEGTAWIAMAFLLVFSIWLIASGLGYADRYIIVSAEKITLRRNMIIPSVIFTPENLKRIELLPLTIRFHTDGRKVTLKLGTYYPEHSAEILKAVESFCLRNKIEIL